MNAGDRRWRGKLVPPPHCHPLVRVLFAAANEQQTTLSEIGRRAGIRRKTMSDWGSRRLPRIDLLEACLNVLDLELVVVEKREPPASGARLKAGRAGA